MIRIENKITGEIVETDTRNWRLGLNTIKGFMDYNNAPYSINTKASNFINKVKYGYEDDVIKADIIKGDWR